MRCKHFLPLVSLALACSAEAPCPTYPCPQGVAFEITLTGSPVGTPLTTASYRLLPDGASLACNQGASANTCVLMGSPGTYQVEISAPSYTTVQRTIVVSAKPAPRCSCVSDETQFLTIAMSPTS